jgi:hypothetical protein
MVEIPLGAWFLIILLIVVIGMLGLSILAARIFGTR